MLSNVIWSRLTLHKLVNILPELPPLLAQEIFSFLSFFSPFFIQWHIDYFLTSALQHCSILSRAELSLNVFCALQIPSPRSCQPNGSNKEALQYEIKELKQKDLALDQEIAQLLSEYVLGKLTVHCDASIIFVLLKQSMVQLKADLLCHFFIMVLYNVGYRFVLSCATC